MDERVPGRQEAVETIRADRERTMDLIDALDPERFVATGLGGGAWSPKDLVGHLESWDQHALDALDAWARQRRPPIAEALEALGTDEVNRREVERKAAMGLAEMRSSAAATHARLLVAFEGLTDTQWEQPPRSDADRSMGAHLGGILGGSLGLFRHDPDHWADLEAFARG
jgi:hypothetical protein